MPKPLLISEQLRRAIQASDLTRYRIAKRTGLSQSLLSRFASGDRGLSLDAIDKIGALLGLRLVSAPTPRENKR
jgi:transcriptional regulator with XRE-family HTH domain